MMPVLGSPPPPPPPPARFQTHQIPVTVCTSSIWRLQTVNCHEDFFPNTPSRPKHAGVTHHKQAQTHATSQGGKGGSHPKQTQPRTSPHHREGRSNPQPHQTTGRGNHWGGEGGGPAAPASTEKKKMFLVAAPPNRLLPNTRSGALGACAEGPCPSD